jgi:hypothetical protein
MLESCSSVLPSLRSAAAKLKSDSTVDKLISFAPTSWFVSAWAIY